MRGFARRLSELGHVETFDYAYQREGRRSPDKLPKLVDAHRAAYEQLRAKHPGPLVFIGKSMGSRIGCHLANELGKAGPAALVCLGYPLVGQNGALRDAVLLELKQPILFVQGTRDALCPLEQLEKVRLQMTARHELYAVDGGDHSLHVGARVLKAQNRTQAEVDDAVLQALRAFIEREVPCA